MTHDPACPCKNAAFRPVAMHNVRLNLVEPRTKLGEGQKVAGPRIALDRRGFDPEAKAAGNMRKRVADAAAHPAAVEKHPELMAPQRLLTGQIERVSEQSSERRAKHMDDFQISEAIACQPHRRTNAHGAFPGHDP